MNLSESLSVPDIGTSHGLPVVVYIYAGGYGDHLYYLAVRLLLDYFLQRYEQGNASLYPPAELVTDSQNRAIALSIQYRLGAFGKVCSSVWFAIIDKP